MALGLGFPGANPRARLEARSELAGRANYLIGSQRHTNLPTYGKIVYRELWPGIDLSFRGQGGRLTYEFLVRPRARVSDIRLAYRGAKGLRLGGSGALLIDTPLGPLRDAAPRSYQRIGGKRVPVKSRYSLPAGGSAYGFQLASYDRSRPLVIDPRLAYSTYLGGFSDDTGLGVAVDEAGSAYVTGFTDSSDFPTSAGAFQTRLRGSRNAFVTKLNAAGSALAYSTYLGGSSSDEGHGIAVDEAGSAYVTGTTFSPDFPTTVGALDTSYGGNGDAFVAKLDAPGSSVAYSTYLGGSSGDTGLGIAVDPAGSAYVTGVTDASDFPTTAGAPDTSLSGNGDAFVAKLDTTGSSLAYSTYLGGSSDDHGFGVAVDAAGSAYVTGFTDSTDFPTSAGAFQTRLKGFGSAFVAKLNAAGSALTYSTYLGGSSVDEGLGVAVDAAGSAYITGGTSSRDFPTSARAFQTGLRGFGNAFVAKLNAAGSALAYSTYLGGSLFDRGFGIAVDAAGRAYVTGETVSSDFPTTARALDASIRGRDAFVAKLKRHRPTRHDHPGPEDSSSQNT